MKKVIIASKNPVKIESVRQGFLRMFSDQEFEFIGISVPSEVPDQPIGNQQTLQGALNRASNIQKEIEADFYVGIEGGVEFIKRENGNEEDKEKENGEERNNEELSAFAWVVIKGNNLFGKAKTGTFFLPNAISRLVKEGKELGDADDIVFKQKNSKQQNGGIGILTHDVLTRATYYQEAVILALIPWKNKDLY